MSITDLVLFAVVCSGLAGVAGAAEPKHGDLGSETVKVGDATRECTRGGRGDPPSGYGHVESARP